MRPILTIQLTILGICSVIHGAPVDWPAPMVSGVYKGAVVAVRGDTVEMMFDKDSAAGESFPYMAAGLWNGKEFDVSINSASKGVLPGKLLAREDGSLCLRTERIEKVLRVEFYQPFVRVGVTRRAIVHRDEDWGDQAIPEGVPVGVFDETPKPGCDWCHNDVRPAKGIFYAKQKSFIALGHGARENDYSENAVALVVAKPISKRSSPARYRRFFANQLVDGMYLQNLRVIENQVGDGWSVLRVLDRTESPDVDEQLLLVRPDDSLAAKAVWFPENDFAKRLPRLGSGDSCEDPAFAVAMGRWIDSMVLVGRLPGAGRGESRKGYESRNWGAISSIWTAGKTGDGLLCEVRFAVRSPGGGGKIRYDTLSSAILMRKHEGRWRPAVPFFPFADRINSAAKGK